MKKYVFSIAMVMIACVGFAQTKTQGSSAPPQVVNFSDTSKKDFDPALLPIDKQVIPSSEYGDKKEILHRQRMEQRNATSNPQKKSARANVAVNPQVVFSFEGNVANGAPSDNDIAVSDSGKILSAVNTNVRVYSDSGLLLLTRSLTQLTSQLGSFTKTSDPRVLYDPAKDRFVFVCFSGSLSTESTILVGFSQTNDPAGAWNFYKLNGNSFKDSTWSDYPIIAVSGSDLFITFNQVRDNVSWTVGFKQSVIWQIDKQRGYDGDTLQYTLWSDIKTDGRNLRNICPAKQHTTTQTDNMYFLSVRNVDASNDSIFLLEINNSHASGAAQLITRVLKSPTPYGFPPNALQGKNAGGITQQLMTNDARVLAAIYENDYIHFGSNTINPSYINAAVLLGTIKNVSSATPTVSTALFSSVTTEYGYPSVTYMGNVPTDHKVLYTFSHCITDSFPGTSMLYKDANGDFSDIVEVKSGLSIIDNFTDSIERWGDYTNIQRVYNTQHQAFLAGSFGQTRKMKTWVAKIDVNDPTTSIPEFAKQNVMDLYPNPVQQKRFVTTFTLAENENLSFSLLDQSGRLVSMLLETKGYKGVNEFSISTSDLPQGNYWLKVKGENGTNLSRQVAVE